ncbi:TPT domain-containing protein [Mycena kentingensis (nom. inval.)]|nr:TPT domain-containing protein [Mycena kentingensis (nom. inval.)]
MQAHPENSTLKVAAVICFYIVAALVMVLVNKAVLNQVPGLPFTFICIQFSIAVFLLRFLAVLSNTPVQRILPCRFEVPLLDRTHANKLLPLLGIGYAGLVFNTLCLATVDATFFQIARGLLLPFTIIASCFITRSLPNERIVIAALVVTLGFFVGAAESYTPSESTTSKFETVRALCYGLISSVVLAMHATLSKVATSTIKHSVFTISYWGNLFMAIMSLPLILLNGEVQVFRDRLADPTQNWTTFIVGCGVTGVVGFLLGLANVLSIKMTSPTSHMFAAAAKTVIQTLLAVLFFGDRVTVYRVAGLALITAGTIFYTWSQARAHARKQNAAYQPVATRDDDLEKQMLFADDEDQKDVTEMRR